MEKGQKAGFVAVVLILLLVFLVLGCRFLDPGRPSTSVSFFDVKLGSGVSLYIFDGIRLVSAGTGEARIIRRIPVTEGNYFVLFFVRRGFVPQVRIFRAGGGNISVGRVSLESIDSGDAGYLAGVVYMPVHGGKIRPHSGILRLFKGVKITIKSETGDERTVVSDERGVFMLMLRPGRYVARAESGGRAAHFSIEVGETAIVNVQKGAVLF